MLIDPKNVEYAEIPAPQCEQPGAPVDLTDATMAQHRDKLLALMAQEGFDSIVVYADREHGGNFGYLTGFEPRFEEAVAVLHKGGKAALLLGNEQLRMAAHSRITATALHTPFFSLPNQPMAGERPLREVFAEAGITPDSRVGMAGWKMFTSRTADNRHLFDVPHFIVEAVAAQVGQTGTLENAAHLFIDPAIGARATVNANEIAHYEFGAALAACCIFDLLQNLAPGKTELQLAQHLAAFGQPVNVQTICAAGKRFTNAVVSPRAKTLAVGEHFSATMGLRGGLTNRVAYAVHTAAELPPQDADYLERVAKPYWAAAATWYSTVAPGVTGGALYDAIEAVAPKAQYGWTLNPGHLTSAEEWMSSPIAPHSGIKLASGMLLQMDIIFSMPGHSGCNAEDGIALADEALRAQLAAEYPALWQRIIARRAYMKEVLGIPLHDAVLPLSGIAGYVRPFLLEKNKAFRCRK